MLRRFPVLLFAILLSAQVASAQTAIWKNSSGFLDIYNTSTLSIPQVSCPAGTSLAALEIWPVLHMIATAINMTPVDGRLSLSGLPDSGSWPNPFDVCGDQPIESDPQCIPFHVTTRIRGANNVVLMDLNSQFRPASTTLPSNQIASVSSGDYWNPSNAFANVAAAHFAQPAALVTNPAVLTSLTGSGETKVRVNQTHTPFAALPLIQTGNYNASILTGMAVLLQLKYTCF